MKEHIINYYLSEKHGSAVAATIAALIIVISYFTWRASAPASLLRGSTLALMLAGTFIAAATIGNALYNTQRINKTKAETITDNNVRQQAEITRMEKVMASAYIGGLTLFSLAIVAGIIMFFFTPRAFIKGIGIGLLLFGMLGVTMELLSMKRNRHYLETIRQIKFNQ